MKIANNVALLAINGGQSDVYLILTWDDNSLVLVDAGFPGQKDAIVEAIASEGFCASKLTHIIITHQDIDHIGCVSDLRKYSPELRILAHKDEAPYIDGRKTPIKIEAKFAELVSLTKEDKMRYERQKEYYDKKRIEITETVNDRDVLPLCGGIEILHTPGHTPGHIVLYLHKSRIMICGDAVGIVDGKLTMPDSLHTYDISQTISSLNKIKKHDISGVVLCHHGYIDNVQWDEQN